MPSKTTLTNAAQATNVKTRNFRENVPSIRLDDMNADDIEEEDNDETNMLEMISMLQDFQKRRTKTATKASAFILKKNALYDAARKNASTAVREGVAYIEQYKGIIETLKAQEVSQDQRLKELSLFAEQEEAVCAILGEFPPLFEDVSRRRADIINETSAMLEAHSIERHQSRRRLVKNAKDRLDQDYENQRVATDASALIKHYKALLKS